MIYIVDEKKVMDDVPSGSSEMYLWFFKIMRSYPHMTVEQNITYGLTV